MQDSIYFPTTIVDGFFDDPDAIRSLAFTLDCRTSPNNNWPGIRSHNLYEVANPVYNTLINRILRLFYCTTTKYGYSAKSFFQFVNNNYKEGWIHRDDGAILSAIIYLTPDSLSVTSIFKKKDIMYEDCSSKILKEDAYKNNTDNLTALVDHNSHYEEVINVKGLYNRLVLFDSRLYHGAHKFHGTTKDTSRLTLITFIENIFCEEMFPIPRSKWQKGLSDCL